MRELLRRHPPESLRQAGLRLAAFLVVPLALAGLWALLRAPVIYHLACINLGNHGATELIERALVERHPRIEWSPAIVAGAYEPWSMHLLSFDSGRRKFAIINPTGESSFYASGMEYHQILFDGRLDRIASIRTANVALAAPDDRDGDGTIELLLNSWSTSAGTAQTFHCVARLGEKRHALIAVVEQSTTTSGPAAGWSYPTWTNSDQDALHELEWVTWGAGPTPAIKSLFKLRWLNPGRMTVDGALPAGFKIWLAQDPDEVTIEPGEPLEPIIRRVMGP